jgi:hypothetical protein
MDEETALLLGFLDGEREHVLGILEGFSKEQLRRPVLPSGWSCLGMVKHLTLADEHHWFRCVVGGEDLGFFPEGPDAGWRLGPGETAEDVFGLYREEIGRANAIIAATPSTCPPGSRTRAWANGENGSPASKWSRSTCSRRPPTTPATSTQPPSSWTAASGS